MRVISYVSIEEYIKQMTQVYLTWTMGKYLSNEEIRIVKGIYLGAFLIISTVNVFMLYFCKLLLPNCIALLFYYGILTLSDIYIKHIIYMDSSHEMLGVNRQITRKQTSHQSGFSLPISIENYMMLP